MNYSKLKDICITTQGIQISKDKQINKFKEGYIKYLYIADFKGENEEKFVENVYPEKIVTENDLVMANTGSPGAVFKGINGVLSNNLFKISFDRNILDRDFLYYYLASDKFQSNLQQRMKGGVQKHLGHKTIGEQDIPIIDINTQKRIVTVLNKSQKLIDKRKEQIEALDELVKSKFIEMFGDPITNPKNIEQVYLKDLSKLITKGASPNWQGIEYVDDETQTLFVTSENVREGYIDLSKKKFLMDAFNEKQKRSVLQSGDFLINIVGASIGRAAQFNLDIKANINQAVALVRLKDGVINDKYLLTYLNSPKALKMYESMQVSVARANLSLQNINDLEILLPPIELQNQFADFVKQVDKLKFEMEKSLKELEDNFNSLMQKAFKGELFN